MFDRLFDFLRDAVGLFRCGVVVDSYQVAVILRLGRPRKIITEPGFYWMAPFYIDTVLADTAVLSARDMPMQVLTLRDGTSVAAGPVISFETSDPEKFFLHVDNAEAAILDAARGTIREVLSKLTWEEASGQGEVSVTELLTKAVRKMAWRYGIEVKQVALSDLAKVRTYRLITGE